MLSLKMEITEIYAWIVCLGMRGSRVLWARLNQRLLFDVPNSAFRAPVHDLLVGIEHRHL